MFHQSPVRPPSQPPDVPGGGGGDAAPTPRAQGEEDEEEEVDPKLALMDDPIVGVEPASSSHKGPEPKPLRTPPTMSQAEKDKHDLTHQPPHPGCPICASSRTANLPHTHSHEHLRTIPLLVGDY